MEESKICESCGKVVAELYTCLRCGKKNCVDCIYDESFCVDCAADEGNL